MRALLCWLFGHRERRKLAVRWFGGVLAIRLCPRCHHMTVDHTEPENVEA